MSQFEHPETLRALQIALKMLARKDHSEYQLREAFSLAFEPETIDECIQFLQSHRFQDDFRLARIQIERNQGRFAKGDQAIRHQLISKGISESMVNEVLQEFGGSEIERASELVEKKFGDEYDRVKVARFLFSRGYTEETISTLLGDLLFGELD